MKRISQYENEKINNLNKYLIVRPIFGLGNRFRAIASAYSVCKATGHKLIINWIKDCHCDCNIEDLITNINEINF